MHLKTNNNEAQRHPCAKVTMKKACHLQQKLPKVTLITDQLLGLEIEILTCIALIFLFV